MSEVVLKRIVGELDELEADELGRLSSIVQQRLTSADEGRRHAFRKALRAAGLVRQFNIPGPAETPERRLIEVIGEPVSETIIKERR
jgi:hypothetical protein